VQQLSLTRTARPDGNDYVCRLRSFQILMLILSSSEIKKCFSMLHHHLICRMIVCGPTRCVMREAWNRCRWTLSAPLSANNLQITYKLPLLLLLLLLRMNVIDFKVAATAKSCGKVIVSHAAVKSFDRRCVSCKNARTVQFSGGDEKCPVTHCG